VFEANRGQAAPPVRFVAQRPGHALLLAPAEAILLLDAPPSGQRVLRVRFEGARPAPEMEGETRLPGRVHYLIGRDPRRWQRHVPLFARVAYRRLYPFVDLVVRSGEHELLEYDFHVAPGGAPQDIALSFTGARALEIDERGPLRIVTDEGVLVQSRPIAYQ
jgi:hypothetical protein